MELVARVQILDETVCISFLANSPEKDITSCFLSQVWLVGQADFFTFD